MTFSSSLSGDDRVLILDASVIINVIGSGSSEQIFAALPVPPLVSSYAVQEIVGGGREEASIITALLDRNALIRADLAPSANAVFASLVSGSTPETLGDGEAATIAIAKDVGGVAMIDEKQGWRIAGGRFPSLQLATTIDLFALPTIIASLGPSDLSQAVLNALMKARMQVREHQLEWVIDQIGAEAAGGCRSLARLMRMRAGKPRKATRPLLEERR
jgi:predicted nucleic acid-binding protein